MVNSVVSCFSLQYRILAVSYTHLDVYKRQANTKVFTQNTSGIIVKVKDSAGNITTYGETINITNIDKTGPNTPFIYEYMGLVYLYPGDEQIPVSYTHLFMSPVWPQKNDCKL